MKKFNLNPSASVRQKSFYGKAKVMHDEETGIVQLKSYDTIVCMIDNFGKFHKLWNGYSATTMKHVQSFCDYYGIENGGKNGGIPCPAAIPKNTESKLETVSTIGKFQQYSIIMKMLL